MMAAVAFALVQVPAALIDVTGLGEFLKSNALWRWGVLLGGILIGIIGGRLIQWAMAGLGRRAAAHGWRAQATALGSAASPASTAMLAVGLHIGLMTLKMSQTLQDASLGAVRLLYIFALAWFLYNFVDIVDAGLRQLAARTRSTLDDQLVPLIRKALRLFIVVVFALFTAQNVFGADITAWLAGLGIAGLAVSLGAQDSIKNLFGSLTIFMDRPFAVGDRIVVGTHDGFVEEIGFRSTKMRTLVGHVVTIPNSAIVADSVENIQRRPSIRRLLNVTITYDTPPDKVNEAVQIIRDILAVPAIAAGFDMEKAPPRVYFNDFNADSLNIVVLYWFEPADWWAYQAHGQEFNLLLLRRFNDAGIDFAFPTRTLFLAGDAKRPLDLHLPTQVDGSGDGRSRPGQKTAS